MLMHSRPNACLTFCLLLSGAGWWDGLEVGPEDFNVQKESYERAVERVTQRLASSDEDDLMTRCRSVIEAGLAWHRAPVQGQIRVSESGDEVVAPETPAWLLCVTALRRVGDSGDNRWVPVLEELQGQWLDAAGRYEWDREHVPAHLNYETGLAYKRIVLDQLEPAEIIERWRQARIRLVSGTGQRRSAAATGVVIAFRELIDKGMAVQEMLSLYTDPEPIVRQAMLWNAFSHIHPEADDLVIGMLADPDPELRSIVVKGLTMTPREDDRRVPALLRFLQREDVEEEARSAAIRGLLMRGYTPATGPDGRPMAIPLRDDREPILLPSD